MRVLYLIFALVFVITMTKTASFRIRQPLKIRSFSLQANAVPINRKGNVVVTGVGQSEQDEFLLGLINEQELWSKITLLTDDVQEARKRFLSRSARYSGLLNHLEFSDIKFNDPLQRQQLLVDSFAWIAFNVNEQDIVTFAAAGIAAGVKRAVFSLELPPERVNDTSIPAFEAAAVAFHEAGGAFTGIRHGTVVAGTEDSAYEIVNATQACVESTVPKGVLARVVSEALRIEATHHSVFGVSSSGPFAGAYLNILRASGLSRQQEVEKIFKGGIQRVAQLVQKGKDEKDDRAEQENDSAEHHDTTHEQEQHQISQTASPIERLPGTSTVYDDFELDLTQNEEQQSDRDLFRVQCRTQELLEDGFQLFCAENPHLLINVTKNAFWKANEGHTQECAMAEVYHFREKVKLAQYKHQATALGKKLGVADEERRQFARLLTLKHRRAPLTDLSSQSRTAADAWVRYVYLLLESVTALCEHEGVALGDLQPHEQTLLLRSHANGLRAQCGLASSDLLCDPRDAAEVVMRLTHDPVTRTQYGLQRSTAEIVALMREKYSDMLHALSTLHLPAKVLKDAIITLKGKKAPTSLPVALMVMQSSDVLAKRYGDGLAALSHGPTLVRADQIQFTAPAIAA